VDDVDELAGIGQTHPLVAAAIAVFMFSLAGVPPLAGFWGKFALFSGAIELGAPVAGEQSEIQPWFLALAIVGVANAAIAAAYYLRVVATMYFRSPESAAAPVAADAAGLPSHEPAPAMAAAICLVLVIAVGVVPWPAMEASDTAGRAVFQSNATEPTGDDETQTAQLR
jgi:NADH-quinone oxidoreductase subunit N